MSTPTPFPFLSLPKELRLIVYSLVSPATKHLPILLPTADFDTPRNDCTSSPPPPPCLKLVHIAQPFLPLLLTCRQIHSEAYSILRKEAASLATLPVPPIRIIATTAGLSHDRLLEILVCIALTPTNCPYSNDIRKLITTITGHEHSTLPLQPGEPKRHVDVAIVNPSVRADGMKGNRQALEQDMLDLGFDLKYCGVERAKLKVNVRVRAAGLEGKEESEMFGEVEAPRTVERGMCWFVRVGKAITREEWERDWRAQ